ncbi:NYN domain-containing protein [Verrucomicrobiaceae bacterium N1E253]|uniref:NYN domain-containing protein n=1 Tax=Oceaniferula marina TaxID=2748318 RepID=A0A851GFW5_9BACT|nr:NYN domain-containing protein [Oceaniferula marina]NWK56099.1 NYN domain-containing protein [Oceaniferula marina]
MEQVLIVDGHSAIFAWPDLLALHRQSTSRARSELVSMLTRYRDATAWHVVVVFDGKGKQTDRQGGGDDDILVVYSRAGETADTVIERMVARKAGEMRITVASNDRLELETVAAFGADCIGMKTLREMLDDQDSEQRRKWKY